MASGQPPASHQPTQRLRLAPQTPDPLAWPAPHEQPAPLSPAQRLFRPLVKRQDRSTVILVDRASLSRLAGCPAALQYPPVLLGPRLASQTATGLLLSRPRRGRIRHFRGSVPSRFASVWNIWRGNYEILLDVEPFCASGDSLPLPAGHLRGESRGSKNETTYSSGSLLRQVTAPVWARIASSRLV